LRQSTGAGFKDCSVALNESNGNLDKAVEILRVNGVAKASKKMSREAREGVIALYGNENKTSILEVNCETDFVAKNNDFISFANELSEINNSVDSDTDKLKKKNMKNNKTVDENLLSMIAKIGEKITLGRSKTLKNDNAKNFFYLHTVVKDNLSKLAVIVSLKTKEKFEKLDLFGKQLTMHIAASNPIAINSSEIKKEIIDKEQKLIREELKNSGKPEEIANKIRLGKIKKFKEENSLMTQSWVMEPKKKVKDIIEELKINDLQIVEFYRLKIGE
jgi:elongation factor Ts